MTATSIQYLSEMSGLNKGQHAGFFYRNPEEHRAVITEYLRQGLENKEKILYIADSCSADVITDYLSGDGLEIKHFLNTEQLSFMNTEDAYIKNGEFNLYHIMDTLWKELGNATAAGYSVFRITSEMSWAAGKPGVLQQIAAYEAELNRFLHRDYVNCLSLCQYDISKFPPEFLLEILATHPIVIAGGEVCINYNYQSPEIFLSPKRNAVRLESQLNNIRELNNKKALTNSITGIKISEDSIKHCNRQLDCCVQTEQLIAESKSVDETFKKLVQILPEIAAYPEKAGARIVCGNKEYVSRYYKPSDWKIRANIPAGEYWKYILEIVYAGQCPTQKEAPFSSIEQETLQIIASMVSGLIIIEKNMDSQIEQEYKIDRKTARHIDFTTAMAHEIKNRLTPILSSSDMLAMELHDEPWREMARSINRGALALDERLNGMLDIIRSMLGNFSIERKKLYLREIIDDVVKELHPAVKHYRQSLVVNIPDRLPQIMADKRRLKQVLASFTETAIKVTPEGGIIKLLAKVKGGLLIVEVTDTSPGMTEEQINILQALKPSRAGRESLSGLGFGLLLSRKIIELHKGEMWITSQSGKGNVFGFSLPTS